MQRIRFTLVTLSLFALFGLAFAQTTDVIYNLPLWGQSVLTFAIFLSLFTQAVKGRLRKIAPDLPSFIIQLGTLGLGVGIAYLIYSQNLLLDPFFATLPAPLNWLAFGSFAGLGAIGGYELLLQIVSVAGNKTVGGKVITVPAAVPTQAQVDQQIDAVPSIAATAIRGYALSQGVPAFIVDAVLALNPIGHATALINDIIARKRKLTPQEIAADQLRWAEANPVTEEELQVARERLNARQVR